MNLSSRRATVTTGVRVVVGLTFVFFGTVKFMITEYEVKEFVKFGLPDSALVVYLVGLVEACAGLLLTLGVAVRPAALTLAIVMTGAILTAGLTVGGPFHLGVAPIMLGANLYLLWTGSGSRALDRHPV